MIDYLGNKLEKGDLIAISISSRIKTFVIKEVKSISVQCQPFPTATFTGGFPHIDVTAVPSFNAHSFIHAIAMNEFLRIHVKLL